MWERDRPYIGRYFARVQQLESYNKAITVTPQMEVSDVFRSPFFWCFVGFVMVGGGVYMYNKVQEYGSIMAALKGNPPPAPSRPNPFQIPPATKGGIFSPRDSLTSSPTSGLDGTRGISYSKGK